MVTLMIMMDVLQVVQIKLVMSVVFVMDGHLHGVLTILVHQFVVMVCWEALNNVMMEIQMTMMDVLLHVLMKHATLVVHVMDGYCHGMSMDRVHQSVEMDCSEEQNNVMMEILKIMMVALLHAKISHAMWVVHVMDGLYLGSMDLVQQFVEMAWKEEINNVMMGTTKQMIIVTIAVCLFYLHTR